jgi:putative tryptophan/tyrosine transport system substrate-binding protein
MRRQEFITLLGGIGQQAPPVVAFFDELRLNGFIERQNITAVAGSFGLEGRPFAERAATVVTAAPDVIVTGGNPATRAVQDATGTLPIVDISNDMVGEGLVRSLARPGRKFDRRNHPLARTRRQATRPPHRGGAPRATSCGARRPQYATPQQLQALQDAA